jgi:hypothetical protein
MEMKSVHYSLSMRHLLFLYVVTFVCFDFVWGGNPENQCVLRFDSKDVESVLLQDLQSASHRYDEKQCTESRLLLTAGTYKIIAVKFQDGPEVLYKNKTVIMTPEKETVVTFNKLSDDCFEVKNRGTFFLVEYNPKAFWDDEFYSNSSKPPSWKCYKGRRLVYSSTFEYG